MARSSQVREQVNQIQKHNQQRWRAYSFLVTFIHRTPQALQSVLWPKGPARQTGVLRAPHWEQNDPGVMGPSTAVPVRGSIATSRFHCTTVRREGRSVDLPLEAPRERPGAAAWVVEDPPMPAPRTS